MKQHLLNLFIIEISSKLHLIKLLILIFWIVVFISCNEVSFCASSTCGPDMPCGKPCPKCGLTREYFDEQKWYERHGETICYILIPIALGCSAYNVYDAFFK